MKRAAKRAVRSEEVSVTMTWRVDEAGKAQIALQRFVFRREAVLAALNLPANARLQFGGREWLQDFDDASCLIVTVPR